MSIETPEQRFAEMFSRPPEEAINLPEYWAAPGVDGGEWEDKPHRLLYDCLRELHHRRLGWTPENETKETDMRKFRITVHTLPNDNICIIRDETDWPFQTNFLFSSTNSLYKWVKSVAAQCVTDMGSAEITFFFSDKDYILTRTRTIILRPAELI